MPFKANMNADTLGYMHAPYHPQVDEGIICVNIQFVAELKTILFDPMDKNGDGIVVIEELKHAHDKDCSDRAEESLTCVARSRTVVQLACVPA